MRFRLGMFDSADRVPYRDLSKYGASMLDSKNARSLALRAAEESIVLLRNDRELLPLQTSTSRLKLGILGPAADDKAVLVGGKQDYCPAFTTTPLEALQSFSADVTANIDIVACDSVLCEQPSVAREFAASVDVVILCLGGRDKSLGREGFDQITAAFPNDQLLLAD